MIERPKWQVSLKVNKFWLSFSFLLSSSLITKYDHLGLVIVMVVTKQMPRIAKIYITIVVFINKNKAYFEQSLNREI